MPTDLSSDTTNSEGKAVLSATMNNIGTQSLKIVENTTNQQIPTSVEVVNIQGMYFETDTNYMLTGSSKTIKIHPYSLTQETIPNLLVHVMGGDYVTDANGNVYYVYESESEGEVTIQANCGNYTGRVTLYNVISYYSSNELVELGLNYNVSNTVAVSKRYNGIEFAVPNDRTGTIAFMGTNDDDNWSLEFNVISYSLAKNTMQTSSFMANGVLLSVSESELQSHPKIRIVKLNGTVRLFVDDVLKDSTGTWFTTPILTLGRGQAVILDNIIFRKVGDGA